jgi:hypothetical protein
LIHGTEIIHRSCFILPVDKMDKSLQQDNQAWLNPNSSPSSSPRFLLTPVIMLLKLQVMYYSAQLLHVITKTCLCLKLIISEESIGDILYQVT